ncbi:hypothetical protein [Microbacterium sp. A1-JK]|uniref:hypothetical protein n=1 Tax=Microbacterium sp. A1-JK TaxID=3177516 RepID=UPI0038861068
MADPISVTQTVCDYLTAGLPGTLKAYGRVPSPRPKKFVRVRVTGGGGGSLVTINPTVTVEAYASAESDAEQLAETCDYLMRQADIVGWLGDVPCRSVEAFARPGVLPDPLTPDQGRFTALYSLVLKSPLTL